MRKSLLALMISLVFLALPAYGADSKPAAEAVKSPERMTSEVKDLLTRERFQNVFDIFWRLRVYGVTWQPQLCAPSDLVGKLDDEQLRMYAGMKLFDAVYAATFMQRKAVGDAVEALERIHEKLNLRSYADVRAKYFTTLKKAAADPESVNVQQLLDQLATDYVQDIPALMSNPQTADYLINVLYGFTVEFMHTLGYFYTLDTGFREKLDNAMHRQPDRKEWPQTIFSLFKSVDRMNENIPVSGGTISKTRFIEQVVNAQNTYTTPGTSSGEDAAWKEINTQCAAIRQAILTPSK